MGGRACRDMSRGLGNWLSHRITGVFANAPGCFRIETHLANRHNAACGGLDHAGDDFGSHGGWLLNPIVTVSWV